MKDIQVLDCLQPEIITLERVNYFARQLLTVDDMVTERDYMLQKLRRHNRYLHGWGVVCGLEVKAAPTAEKPWLVRIGGGYALGPYGDEIYVVQPVVLDLAKCGPHAMTDPCDPGRLRAAPGGVGAKVYVAIKYAECLARAVKAMPAGCGCDDDPCEYSRIRDSFQVTCLTELPPSHRPPKGPSICEIIHGKLITPCPVCPGDPWVVLAEVKLPAIPATKIADPNINNTSVRRVVFSMALIQEQLIKCCCGGEPEEPPDQPPVQPPDQPPDQPPVHPVNLDLSIRQAGERVEIPSALGAVAHGFEFKITVTNSGPSSADNVLLTVKTSPAMSAGGFAFVPDPGWTVVGSTIQRTLGTMPPGSQSFTYRVQIVQVAARAFESVAHVTTTSPETNAANNEAVVTIAVG